MTHERRNLAAWTMLAGLTVFGIMCVPFFLGRVYVTDDLGEFHLPIRDFYSRQLAAGEPWDWMPTLYCGFYLTGEGQLGGYHPLHLILYRTLPLGAAFNLELLLNYPLLAIGTYLFLRRLSIQRDAAAFGALVFTFSSFNLLHFVHPNAVAVVAHLPWLLWAVDIACRSKCVLRSRLALCGIALFTGSQLLLGYPQYVWFSLLCELAYAAYCLTASANWKRGVAVLTALAVGGLIGGIQLLPTIDALADSTRQSAGATFRNSGSLAPLNLVQLVDPYLFYTRVVGQNTHELGLYIGAVPVVLCVWLLAGHKRTVDSAVQRTTRGERFFAVMAVVALLYAFGKFGPVYWLQEWLPFVRSFRFPCRAIVVFQLAAAVLAAIAFSRLVRTRPENFDHSPNIWWLPMASAAIVILSLAIWPAQCKWSLPTAAGPLLISVAVALVGETAKRRRWAPAALILLTAADLASYGLSYAVLPGTVGLQHFAAAADLPNGPASGRILADSGGRLGLRTGNRALLAGYSRADGYAGLEPKSCIDAGSDASLCDANVEWVRIATGWQPTAACSTKVRVLPSTTTIAAVEERPGYYLLQVEGPTSSRLTVSERYHSGWHAAIDGANVPILRAGNFMACQIPAGRHQLELRFTPSSLCFGRLLTLCGLGLTLSWAVFAMVTRRDKA